MPSGTKKRKAPKRKNDEVTVDIHRDDYPTDPNANPNSGFFSPLHPPQGNWRDKRLSLIEDDGDETFETPRFQPQTPRLPETPYYSMENVGTGKSCEIEGPIEGLSAEIPLKEMTLDESEEGEEGGQDDEGSLEAKFDESVHVTIEESLKGEAAMLEKSEKLDNYVHSGAEREKPPQIDMDMPNNKLEKSVEKSSVTVENMVLNTEELSRGNNACQENAAEPSSHVRKTVAAQRNEAARGPVVERRATFWNCCGLLEVFTSPDR